MRWQPTLGLVAIALAGAACENAGGSQGEVALTPVGNVGSATAMAVRPGDATLYVAEQDGHVRAVRDGLVDPRSTLDISDRVTLERREQGLVGLAFSPDGSKLYVHYTDGTNEGANQLDEYAMDGRTAVRSSRRPVLTIGTLQPNHNGGQLAFGPDGLLYIGVGDGGAAGDRGPGHAPEGNGQSLDTLLGKILRIDPAPAGDQPYTVPADNPFAARDGGRPEIWAYGLRNPWRFSFDRETGDLWLADVGQSAWEEVDYAPAGTGSGANYGWARFEGTHPFDGVAPPNAIPPVFEFPNPDEGCAVTGGFVYRGTEIPDLAGDYVFADYCTGELRALRMENGQLTGDRFLGVAQPWLASFGQDNDGELYVVTQHDGLFRLDAP
jgi:glucose/arabinose dehydrogenase